jgi:hypothetical protein
VYNEENGFWQNVEVRDYLVEDKPSTFFAGNMFDILNSGFFVENTIVEKTKGDKYSYPHQV